MLSLRVVIPFLLTGTIWGSTWWVITGQIDGVPPSWSVFYRFLIATPAMFLLAMLMKRQLAMGAKGHLLALAVGISQFCGNFNFVYFAELHLTSGIVAVMFALMIVPNALFGRMIIGERITRAFMLGSMVAIAGVVLLLTHEARLAPLGDNVMLGIALAVGGILAASIANVVQANETGRRIAMVSLLAWSMFYGVIADFAFAWWMAGPPSLPAGLGFWAGTIYLALVGSVVTFPLHYNLVREIGAGKTAYNSIVIIIVAMLLSTLFEDYAWSLLAAAGALLAVLGMVLALRARRTGKGKVGVKVGQATIFRDESEP